MKKINYLIVLLISFCISFSYAGEVPMTSARKAAMNFKLNINKLKKSTSNIVSAVTTSYNDVNTFYTFNFEGGGFVIVAADDNITPVLAYSENNFAPEKIDNPSVKYWIDSYNHQIYDVIVNKKENYESKKEWNRMLNNTFSLKSGITAGPLLSTTWDQGCYYNDLCPADAAGPCGKVWAGCVATAMAQIMKKHNFPATGNGSYSYYTASYGTQSANFGATNYDWASMPYSVTSSNSAVATLLYHCGVAVKMQYSPNGSGAYVSDALYAMKNYFKYPNAALVYRSNYTDADWQALLRTDIDGGLPIFYTGVDNYYRSGHAFVCDGYDLTLGSYYHFNWGWSGHYDGYYLLSNLNPGRYNFSSSCSAIINLRPENAITCTSNIVAQGSTTFCQGGNVVLAANSGMDFSYKWLNGGNIIEGATLSTYTATTSGTYSAIVIDNNNCISTSNSINVNVLSAPLAVVTPAGPVTIKPGKFVNLTTNKVIGIKYQWVRNGVNITGATKNSLKVTQAGIYAVSETNSAGCSSLSNAVTVIIQGQTKSLTGNENVALADLNIIYPNPFNDKTNITYTLSEKSQVAVKIYNMLGREVATIVNNIQESGRYEAVFDANGLPSGLYYCRIYIKGSSTDLTKTQTILLNR